MQSNTDKIMCDCGLRCNGHESALQMCIDGTELSVTESLLSELKDTRNYVKMLEELLRCVSQNCINTRRDESYQVSVCNPDFCPMPEVANYNMPPCNRHENLTPIVTNIKLIKSENQDKTKLCTEMKNHYIF